MYSLLVKILMIVWAVHDICIITVEHFAELDGSWMRIHQLMLLELATEFVKIPSMETHLPVR